MKCSIAICERAAFCRGLCNRHYQRQYKGTSLIRNAIDVQAGEIWKPVEDWPRFSVSSFGRISFEGELRAAGTSPNGYLVYTFRERNRRRVTTVHRLVARHFLGEPQEGQQVNHKDGDKLNNKSSNLEWVTASANILHAVQTGLRRVRRGEELPQTHLTEEDVRHIRRLRGLKPQREIAADYGVSQSLVGQIHRGSIWQHVS